MARVFLTEATQSGLGAPDVAVNEAGRDLVDEQGITAVDEEVELSLVDDGLVCGRSRRLR